MDMFDNSILKPHLDQFNEYMMENGEYPQGNVGILYLPAKTNQGTKYKETDFAAKVGVLTSTLMAM